MDRILELHEDDMDIVVQPSLPWMKMNEVIASSGLFFLVDPGPTAQRYGRHELHWDKCSSLWYDERLGAESHSRLGR